MRFRNLLVLILLAGRLPGPLQAQYHPVSRQQAADSDRPHNLIKFNPYMILHGYLPLAYERLLLGRLGVELGGGPTTKDFFYHVFWDMDGGLDSNKGEFAEAKLGYGLHGALRLYLSQGRDGPPAGAFLAMQLQHRVHRWTQNYDLQLTNTQGRLISRENSRELTDFVFLAGYQAIFIGGLVVECNGGLGVRNRVVERYRVDFSETTLVEDRPGKATLVFPVNVKVGYAF